MARTRHHGMKARQRLYPNFYVPACLSPLWRHRADEPTPPKRRRSQQHLMWMTTPGWWIRDMMTRPQRARVRRLTQEALRSPDRGEAIMWPHPKRPHIYYW